jgi:MFS family permease
VNKSITTTRKRSQAQVALYAAIITFLTYATVYGFRKGFTVCTFDGISYGGISYKTWLVVSQVVGYMLSKFYGIRFIAELKRMGRGRLILLLTAISWSGLLLFALVPAPYNIIFMFVNGFPLGMIWGIVFSFVEGRKATDFIGAALAVSFIFSSGLVKSIAKMLELQFHLPELWVPFATGLVFAVPLIVFVYFLEKIPPPTAEDVQLRSDRVPMQKEKRKEFTQLFFPGLVTVVIIYVFSTIFRDIRDNFMADMLKEMGFNNDPSLFTKTETPTTLIILLIVGSMVMIRNNFKALVYSHYFILLGFIISGASSFLFLQNSVSPIWWMTLVGLGLYMTYIPFNCIFFERLIAAFKVPGNVGFLIYIADSFGYLGSVGVLITKEILHIKLQWTSFYSHSVITLSVIGMAGTIISLIYFSSKYKKEKAELWTSDQLLS